MLRSCQYCSEKGGWLKIAETRRVYDTLHGWCWIVTASSQHQQPVPATSCLAGYGKSLLPQDVADGKPENPRRVRAMPKVEKGYEMLFRTTFEVFGEFRCR
jgi:hypothetical protein